MININLLGDDAVIDNSGKLIIAGYVASLVICGGIFFSLYSAVVADVNDLTLRASALQSQLDTLKEKTKEVKDLEKKRNTLKQKIALIAKLKKSKIGPVRVLDDLNLAVPRKVWLRQITEKDGLLRIRGRALDNQTLALFMKNLESSDYFEAVDLVESRQMYYDKTSGMVTATATIESLRTGEFQSDSRATKESKTGVGIKDSELEFKRNILLNTRKTRAQESGKFLSSGGGDTKKGILNSYQNLHRTIGIGNSSTGRKAGVGVHDQQVKIKEFIVSVKVRYAGKFGAAVDDAAAAGGDSNVKLANVRR